MAKLYFRYGAMNCGKTTAIIQVAHNYEEKGKQVLLMKPSIDTKGGSKIINRTNLSREVDILLNKDDKVSNYIKSDIAAILIDEAHFLEPAQVDELYEIAKLKNIPVLCYGLRCNFKMIAWPGSARLLQIADDIEEIKTICECGKKATISIRRINNIPVFEGPDNLIDGTQKEVTYESVCGECYIKLRNNQKKGD